MTDGRDDLRQTGKTSNKYAAKKAASERLAAQRAAQQKAARRRNIMITGSATLAVIVVIVVIVVIGVTHKSSTSASDVNPAPDSVTSALTDAATSTLSATPDLSTILGPPVPLSGAALTAKNGQPQVLYIGAEYCPYCAATRWPLAIALSRFGTFSDLKTTYSSSTDSDPHTPTLSFYKSSYHSDYFEFVSVEHADGAGKDLEPLTSEQATLFKNIGGSGYPFIDFGGKWAQRGESIDPGLLKGMTPEQVAQSLTDPSSKASAAIRANADVYTAIICGLDGDKPANVCSAPSVTAAKAALNGSGK